MRILFFSLIVFFLVSGCAVESSTKVKAPVSQSRYEGYSLREELNKIEQRQEEILKVLKTVLSLLSERTNK